MSPKAIDDLSAWKMKVHQIKYLESCSHQQYILIFQNVTKLQHFKYDVRFGSLPWAGDCNTALGGRKNQH